MLDRTIAPPFKAIKSIVLPEIESEILSNGIPVYKAGYASQEIVKLELVFNAGKVYASHKGLSSLFSKMLLGGTDSKSGTEIMSEFDQYGGFIEISQGTTRLQITLHGLKKHLGRYLKTLKDVLENCSFPEEELEIQRKITNQSLTLNLEKSTVLGSRAFKKTLFGENHIYGRNLELTDIESVSREDLIEFYSEYIRGKSFKVFISGNVGSSEISILRAELGSQKFNDTRTQKIDFSPKPPTSVLVERKDKMQSTLRIGRPMFNRLHPDFFKMMVCNTAFGGYFGSRLMKNIREEKGFTYGISSSVTPLKDFGYMVIGADIVKENTIEALGEIWKEVNILQNEKISEDELETIKNYVCGSYAGSVTTSFEIMQRQKNLVLEELPETFYNEFIDYVQAVSSDEVQAMAQKYLDQKAFTEVIVGERI